MGGRDQQGAGLATGALLFILGVWLVARTLVHDAHGTNLVDRIVNLASGGSSSSSGSGAPPGSKVTGRTDVPIPGTHIKVPATVTAPKKGGPSTTHIGPIQVGPSGPQIDTGIPNPFGPGDITIPLP